jgi:hypothetical protein
MGESLTQRRRVWDEGALLRKPLSDGKKKFLRGLGTVPSEEAPANYVPAAAVIRRVRALSGITGCKGCVGGHVRRRLNTTA